jgi:predicted RecA/RadA family phage recombinase
MLNLKNSSGKRVHVRLTAAVASGAFTRAAGIVGIPIEHGLNGSTVVFLQEGLVALTLAIQGTLAQGSYLYWNRTATPTANALSLGAAAGDIEVGQMLEQLSATGPLWLVRMNIGTPRAAAGNAQ